MRKTLLILLSLLVHNVANASLSLSLSEAIRLAQEHSLDAQVARFTFPGSYWTYRSYRAELLPRDPLHNALSKGMNNTIKNDWFFNKGNLDCEQASKAVQTSIDMYNHASPHKTFNMKTPAEVFTKRKMNPLMKYYRLNILNRLN